MNLILGPRHSGRTTRLIHECYEVQGTILSINNYHAKDTQRLSQRLGKPVTVIPFEEFNRKSLGQRITHVYIDDLDQILSQIIRPAGPGFSISGATLVHDRNIFWNNKF